MIRTFAHADVEELARFATVPVINGLTDLLHPCQILADLLTMHEDVRRRSRGRRSPGSATATTWRNSWINAAGSARLRAPAGLPRGLRARPRASLERNAALAAGDDHRATPTRPPAGAARRDHRRLGLDGPGGRAGAQRAQAFQGYLVDEALMDARAIRRAIFLHCLPAHRGEEVTEAVLEGPQSRVWDEAENRLHVQKALMAMLMGGVGEVMAGRRGRTSRSDSDT